MCASSSTSRRCRSRRRRAARFRPLRPARHAHARLTAGAKASPLSTVSRMCAGPPSLCSPGRRKKRGGWGVPHSLSPDHGAVEGAGCARQNCVMQSEARLSTTRLSSTTAPTGRSASGPFHRRRPGLGIPLIPLNPTLSRRIPPRNVRAYPVPHPLHSPCHPPTATQGYEQGAGLLVCTRPGGRLRPTAPSDGDGP